MRLDWNDDEVTAAIDAGTFHGLQVAAEHLLQVSSALAPLEEGDLARSGEVSSDEEAGAVAVSYDRPYLGCSPARGADLPARGRKDRQVPRKPDARRARHNARAHR